MQRFLCCCCLEQGRGVLCLQGGCGSQTGWWGSMIVNDWLLLLLLVRAMAMVVATMCWQAPHFGIASSLRLAIGGDEHACELPCSRACRTLAPRPGYTRHLHCCGTSLHREPRYAPAAYDTAMTHALPTRSPLTRSLFGAMCDSLCGSPHLLPRLPTPLLDHSIPPPSLSRPILTSSSPSPSSSPSLPLSLPLPPSVSLPLSPSPSPSPSPPR